MDSESSTETWPADPIAKGIIPSAKQGLSDLFKWNQRTVIYNDHGEEHIVWQKPAKLKNPISLLMQLGGRDVSHSRHIPTSLNGH